MDNLDDSENNAKVSDSAYSNSCSNSQSRRSHSSKSTHSGSHSSRSSGYGGKQSGYSVQSEQPPDKKSKDKEAKQKKQIRLETSVETVEEPEQPKEQAVDAVHIDEVDTYPVEHVPPHQAENGADIIEKACIDRSNLSTTEVNPSHPPATTATFPARTTGADGFACVISMLDGVVMYTTSSITATLGFPRDMWMGRSFIDFVHSKDRNTFASHITNGLAVPKHVNGTIIEAPNEAITNSVPFIIRHAANGNVEYVDPESVPYLGYLPQDLEGKNALTLYHVDDLPYLTEVYEMIVKEGGVPRCKPYRIITQNSDFIKVETEWSSFINPWSKKLEFVIGKHHVIEGPANPDVFYATETKKNKKSNDESKNKAQALRDNIIRVMNEVLTKPAEVAKQQMTKRCQELASFMESLMEVTHKHDDVLHVELHDHDNNYFERDSVMLGGISPHHDQNDSKSSVETTLSYNQLNYNETLQRYFDSHQQFFCHEDYNRVTVENTLISKDEKGELSPMAQTSLASGEISSCDSGGDSMGAQSSTILLVNTPAPRLTESLISKHNTEMEKDLTKMHREHRTSIKGDHKKIVKENKQKKKEHLARCNASFQPTSVFNNSLDIQPHGLKRCSKQPLDISSHKHHCPAPRQSKKAIATTTTAPQLATNVTTTVASSSSQWPHSSMNNNTMNTIFMGVGFSPQMNVMNAMGGVAGMIPMYYAPAAPAPVPSTPEITGGVMNASFPQPLQYIMYGQAVYGTPLIYSPMNANLEVNSTPSYQLGLSRNNYEEEPQPVVDTLAVRNNGNGNANANSNANSNVNSNADSNVNSNANSNGNTNYTSNANSNGNTNYTSNANSNGNTNYTSNDNSNGNTNYNSNDNSNDNTNGNTNGNSNDNSNGNGKKSSEDTIDRTDGESSYSSFYSSFFKTESGSAEDSGDAKKTNAKATTSCYEPPQPKKFTKRKIAPPWTEHVCVTSELVYKYQVLTKNIEEVLKADKLKLKDFEQPELVNEQLGQLYLDLQLEGVAARLTLEEGITSSSSSGEESVNGNCKSLFLHRKREYNKLAMFYEEDAPLPPGIAEDQPPEEAAEPPELFVSAEPSS